MTDKVQKIREEVEKRFEQIKNSNRESDSGTFYQLKELLEFIDSLQEEPVSEELEEAADVYSKVFSDIAAPYIRKDAFIAGANWHQEKEYTCYEEAFEDGAKWKVENILKPADSDNLPEYDREVIVLTQPYPLESHEFAVSFAHRPNPDGWDGKSVTTDKVEHYTPKTYGKGGWNIPDVKYWLDVKLPKEIEL